MTLKRARGVLKQSLLHDIRRMIEETRSAVAVTVNAGLTMLYWGVGKRINEEILKGKRAEYGEEILQTLSAKLMADFGRGYSARNLASMARFAEVFPNQKIVSALMTQLGWTHFIYIIALEDDLKRDFHAEMCRLERWSVRTPRQKIADSSGDHTAMSVL